MRPVSPTSQTKGKERTDWGRGKQRTTDGVEIKRDERMIKIIRSSSLDDYRGIAVLCGTLQGVDALSLPQ